MWQNFLIFLKIFYKLFLQKTKKSKMVFNMMVTFCLNFDFFFYLTFPEMKWWWWNDYDHFEPKLWLFIFIFFIITLFQILVYNFPLTLYSSYPLIVTSLYFTYCDFLSNFRLRLKTVLNPEISPNCYSFLTIKRNN